MPTRAKLRKDQKQTIMEFAGSAQDDASMNTVRAGLHTALFRQAELHHARRVGPVVWSIFPAKAAPDLLHRAGLLQKGRGLLVWLEQHPGTVVVVGSLDVLMPRGYLGPELDANTRRRGAQA